MKDTTIQFSFDDTKLEAINIYLQGKSSDLDKELADFMDALYKKHVPQAVREFIEKKEQSISEQPRPARKSSPARRAVSEPKSDVGTPTRDESESPAEGEI